MQLSSSAACIAANAVCRLLDGGSLCLLSGNRPSSLSKSSDYADKLVVELSFDAKAFKAAKEGIATANTMKEGVVAKDGKPTWFIAKSASGDVIFTGSVGITNLSDIVLDKPDLKQGDTISLSSFLYSQKI